MTQDILGSDLAAWAAALATGTYVDDVAIGIAVSLLLAGGLQALQTATILFALPFALVIVLMVVALWRALREDWREEARRERELRRRMRELMRDRTF